MSNKVLRLVLVVAAGLWLGVAAGADRARGAAAAAPTAPLLVGADKISAGDTAWMLTSTALVLMMTIPGLALFYGGMVRRKNVLATVMQSFAITCLVTLLWWLIGYSWAFTPGGTAYLGGASRFLHARHDLHEGRQQAQRLAPGYDHPGVGVLDVPADLRDHHSGADHRRVRRPHEVLGHARVHVPVVALGVRANRPLGVGALGLACRPGRARLRRRHRGAHQRRCRRSGQLSGARQAPRLWHAIPCRRTTSL